MPLVLNGDGSIQSLVAGGLPDATVTAAELSGAQTGAAPIYAARAWCVFDGTLVGTNAPIAGGNVSTVTRNSTGNYTVNFTTAMPDALFSTSVTVQPVSPTDFTSNPRVGYIQSKTTASVTITTGGAPTGSTLDLTQVNVTVFR